MWSIGEDTEFIIEENGKKNFEILAKCFETVLSGKKFNIKEVKKEWKNVELVLNKTLKTCSKSAKYCQRNDQSINCYFKIMFSECEQILIY